MQIELPNKWLWDIIDEFVYQFQSFQQFKSKAGKMTEDDKNMLRDEDNVSQDSGYSVDYKVTKYYSIHSHHCAILLTLHNLNILSHYLSCVR